MNNARYYLTQTIEERASFERMILVSLSSVLILLAALYMYFVASAAYAIADQSIVGREIASLESDLARLEGRYLASRAQVTAGAAEAFGLVSASSIAYAQTAPSTATLTFEVR